jgi:hypothetical protein
LTGGGAQALSQAARSPPSHAHVARQSLQSVQSVAAWHVSLGGGGSVVWQALLHSSKLPPSQAHSSKQLLQPTQLFSGVQVAGSASSPQYALQAPKRSPEHRHSRKQSGHPWQALSREQLAAGAGSAARQLEQEAVTAQVRTSAAARKATPEGPPSASMTAAHASRQPPAPADRSQRLCFRQSQMAAQPVSSWHATTASLQF